MDLGQPYGVHAHPLRRLDLTKTTPEGLGLCSALLDVEVVEETEFYRHLFTIQCFPDNNDRICVESDNIIVR